MNHQRHRCCNDDHDHLDYRKGHHDHIDYLDTGPHNDNDHEGPDDDNCGVWWQERIAG